MGLPGRIFSFAIWRFIEFIVIFLLITLVPWFPPHVKVTTKTITAPKPLDPNIMKKILNNADHVLIDKLNGAECLIEYNGYLYTGTLNGEVIKISPQHKITTVAKFGKRCDGFHQEDKCGRPLGLQIVDGNLYVADSYYGIWKVNLETGQKEQLVSPDEKVDGTVPKIFNGLAVASNGDVFWSHSSSDFHLMDGLYTLLADGSGRLVHYKAKEQTNEVLLQDLWFANGVALSPNEDFVLVAETGSSRIGRYFLKGSRKGSKDIFADGLPGLPDNLNVLSDGSGFLAVMYTNVIDPDLPVLSQSIAPFPWIRKFALRVVYMVEQFFVMLNRWYPHNSLEKLIFKIGHFAVMAPLLPKGAYVCRFDWDGKMKEVWYGDDETIYANSDVLPFNGKLYIGSPHSNYISVVPLPESLKVKSQSIPQEQVKLQIDKPVETSKKTGDNPAIIQKPKKMAEASKPVVPKESEPKVEVKTTHQPSTVENNTPTPTATPSLKVEVKKSQGSGPSVVVVTEKPESEANRAEGSQAPRPKTDAKQDKTEEKEFIKKPVVTLLSEPKIELKQDIPEQKQPTPTKIPEAKIEMKQDKPERKRAVPTMIPEAKVEMKQKKPEQKQAVPTMIPEAKTETEQIKPKQKGILPKSAEPNNIPEYENKPKEQNFAKRPTAEPAVKQTKPLEKLKDERESVKKQKSAEIPIVEELKSDTKPPREPTLKVIQKNGPAEIPNPGLAGNKVVDTNA